MIPLTIFGQNNIQNNTDSVSDITITALIFAEHQKLSIENPLLKEEIQYYKELNQICEERDSIHKKEIDIYSQELSNANKHIKKLKSTQKKIIICSTVGGIVLLLIGLFI